MKKQHDIALSSGRHLADRAAISLQDLLGVAWREARQTGEPLMTQLAAGGEFLIAGVRLVLLMFTLPLHFLAVGDAQILTLALLVHVTLVAWSTLALVLVRLAYRTWMGRLFSLVDVTLVTLGLMVFALAGKPELVADSKILFNCYFVAVAFCGLRYDWRLCVITGLVAVVQYLLLMGWVVALSPSPIEMPGGEGDAFWPLQIIRCFVLLGATLVVCVIVMRGTQLRRQSMTDGLTGIHNRGYFDRRYAEEVDRARRFERPLGVCLIDVDHFKQINDQFGHPTGDRILRAIAQHLKSAIRESDVVARIGGEEFAILFPESTGNDVADRLQRLREAIGNMDWLRRPNGDPHPVTVSMGVATYPADGELGLNVLDRADERLLNAKSSGRNRIVLG